MPFDDHGIVVVLEEVVRSLINIEAGRSNEPDQRLAEWATWLRSRSDTFRDAAFQTKIDLDSQLNAIAIAGSFSEFADSLGGDSPKKR